MCPLEVIHFQPEEELKKGYNSNWKIDDAGMDIATFRLRKHPETRLWKRARLNL